MVSQAWFESSFALEPDKSCLLQPLDSSLYLDSVHEINRWFHQANRQTRYLKTNPLTASILSNLSNPFHSLPLLLLTNHIIPPTIPNDEPPCTTKPSLSHI